MMAVHLTTSFAVDPDIITISESNIRPEKIDVIAPPELQRLIKGKVDFVDPGSAQAIPPTADTSIINEGFEGTWPNGAWDTFANTGAAACYWGKTSVSADVGTYSISPVVGGCGGSASGPYPENVVSWAIYGPFSLSDATSALMTFRLKYQLESGPDTLAYLSSVDGINFSGFSVTGGDFSSWYSRNLDLSSQLGETEVWIAFLLQTDSNATADAGVLVDEVVITKSDNVTTADLALQAVNVDPGPYLPGAEILVETETENIGSETSNTYRMDFYASTDTTITAADRSLGYIPDRPALNAGASSFLNVLASLPGDLALGQYYIGAILTVVDANDTNDVNYDPNPITVSADPDISIRPLSLSFEEVPAEVTADYDNKLEDRTESMATVAPILGAEVLKNGKVRVIVGLAVPFQPMRHQATAAVSQRAAINARQDQLRAALAGFDIRENARYQHIPFMALTVDEAALQELYRSPLVSSIELDAVAAPTMDSSNVVIGSPLAWAEGYDGSDWAVAVLDTGVDKTHPWFSTGSKVVSEACYSSNDPTASSLCPGGVEASTAEGSGVNCSGSLDGCSHGTHVAGTVAGNNGVGPGYGVARGADIIAVQVFSEFSDCTPNPSPCILSYSSDQISAMERVLVLSATMDIAAVNMSLGGGQYFTQTSCDDDNSATKAAIDNLRAAGIATVISAGNEYYKDRISSPACISSAISVGATTDSDLVASFSNIYPEIHLLAPGVDIVSSIPGGSTASFQGTSMASPHVAGAWAVLKQLSPAATVTEILTDLQSTATPVSDQRVGGIETNMPRINLDLALGSARTTFGIFNDGPGELSVTSIAPDTTASWISWDPPAPFVVPRQGIQVISVSIDFDLAPQGTTLRRLLISSNDPDSSPYPGGVNISVTTLGGLDTPGNISATDGTFTDKVRVTWDDVVGEDSFQVFRCSTTSTGTCSEIATPAADTTTYDDTGANADGTVHYYRLRACSIADGCSSFSAADSGYRSVPATYSIGGNVSGLSGSGLVLQNNGGNNRTITMNGAFTFSTELNDGASYAVTVLTQPTDPNQTCGVSNGSGTVSTADVTNVQVTCVTNTYSVGGNVSGLTGSGLVLQNNGGNNRTITMDGAYTFSTELNDGTSYAVTVLTQPTNPAEKCFVSNASGTLTGSDITNADVICKKTCNVNTVSDVSETSVVSHEACEILVVGPSFSAEVDASVSLSSGWEIWMLPGLSIKQGATLDANVCGQSLCEISLSPMPDGCHSCVDAICDVDPSCCDTGFDQECVDQVDTVCGLVCE